MKAYSMDFRNKIIETYLIEELSERQLSKRFRVALSLIRKLIKQWKEQRHLKPKPHGGGKQLKLSSEQIIILGDLVEEKSDMTQKELSEELKKRTGVEVSQPTISRVLKYLNFTRKKNTVCQ